MSRPTRPTPQTPSSAAEPEAIHQAFSWLLLDHRTDPNAEFVALTKDVCLGVQTCIDLAHFSTMDRESDTTPVLNIADTERLLRLGSTSLQMLADAASGRIDQLQSRD
ncbi:hypothetical protein [Glaciimonas sp. PAMC28666]|uniref:hypothetical protein n=1 Tax=Glaciimonas sp. PAMC28666 TaxID=2807626 RepID=UPI0019648330|nr:hypothetical protein [Glaciimonas sp. PAMC28666]QRX83973.1 hypothetical protein JQN73_07110 [Glaciimonas sp. PAMC28666]